MCDIVEQAYKLFLMAGQVEHDLWQLFGDQPHLRDFEIPLVQKQIEKRLTARGDLWALECFHRICERIADLPRSGPVAAELTLEQSPGETVNDALIKARSMLT